MRATRVVGLASGIDRDGYGAISLGRPRRRVPGEWDSPVEVALGLADDQSFFHIPDDDTGTEQPRLDDDEHLWLLAEVERWEASR